jgi:hypothetical protein
MTDGHVFQKCKDYIAYFNVSDWRQAKKRLTKLGFKCPAKGAPMIRKEILERKIDNQ